MSKKFHFRFHCDSKSSLAIATMWVKSFKPKKYLFCSEVSKKDKHHIHAEIEYDEVPTPMQRSRFYKKYEIGEPKPYHAEVLKESNVLYILKDGNIVYHNWSETELNEAVEKTEEINEDKQKDIKLKLVEYIKTKLPLHKEIRKEYEESLDLEKKEITKEYYNISLRDIAKYIRVLYTKEYIKLPPQKSLMFQYCVFIADNLNICEDETEQIYDNIF